MSFLVASSLSSMSLICAVRSIFCSSACLRSASRVCSSSTIGFSNSSVNSLISVVNGDRRANRQNRVQLRDVVVEQADAAGARLLADGIGVPCAVQAVALYVKPEPVGAENVLGIAVRDGLAVAAMPRGTFDA